MENECGQKTNIFFKKKKGGTGEESDYDTTNLDQKLIVSHTVQQYTMKRVYMKQLSLMNALFTLFKYFCLK